MSSDIGQDILRSVKADFAKALDNKSGRLGRLFRKIQDGSATMSDVSTFSVLIGQTVSSAVEKRITPDVLPDGTLYFNIAQTVLQGVLRDSHELINLAAQSVQERLDAQQGLHIKPVKPDFPEERIRDIAGAASTASMNKNEEKEQRRLTSPVENVVQSFYSDYVRENADLRSKAGLSAYIIRRTSGRCCPWCSGLAGRYRYEDAPSDIYARHDNCTCTVDFVTNNYRQDVWNKRKYSLSPEERRKALEAAPKPTRYTREQAKNLQDSVLNRVANSDGSGIIKVSGAISGALNPNSKEAQEHADQYYESVRHMTNDVNRIAKNTGFSAELISQIKDFVFMQKHDLGGKELEYFYPSYEMAQSWQRLIEGKNIQPHDLTLLNHEKMERELMAQGYSQNEAHDITSRVYNYGDESREYYANINKHSKNR